MKNIILSFLVGVGCLTMASCSKTQDAKCACDEKCGCKETNPHENEKCNTQCEPWHK